MRPGDVSQRLRRNVRRRDGRDVRLRVVHDVRLSGRRGHVWFLGLLDAHAVCRCNRPAERP